MSKTMPGALNAIQLIKNKMKNITKHDLMMVHIVFAGNLATSQPVIRIIKRIDWPKKPSGKKIITIKTTAIINFKEGLNL
jgi:predicted proteasome-type protease